MPDVDAVQATDNQVRFRADPEMVSAIRERMSPRANGLGGIAKRDLERYYAALEASLPEFGESQAGFILDALAEERVDHQYAHLIWAVIADASRKRGLAERWRIDEEALVARLRDLTPFEKLALVDASEQAQFLYLPKLSRGDDDSPYRLNALTEAAEQVGLFSDR